jgi:hypothetical protein
MYTIKVAICFQHFKKIYWFTHCVPNICENYSDLYPLPIFTDLNFVCNYGFRKCVVLTPQDMLAPELYVEDTVIEVCRGH